MSKLLASDTRTLTRRRYRTTRRLLQLLRPPSEAQVLSHKHSQDPGQVLHRGPVHVLLTVVHRVPELWEGRGDDVQHRNSYRGTRYSLDGGHTEVILACCTHIVHRVALAASETSVGRLVEAEDATRMFWSLTFVKERDVVILDRSEVDVLPEVGLLRRVGRQQTLTVESLL